MTDEIRKIEPADKPAEKTPAAGDVVSAADAPKASDKSAAEPKKAGSGLGSPKNMKYFARLALTLLAITACVALMLGGVNALTADRIVQIAAQKRLDAMSEVLPGYTVDGEDYEADTGTVTRMTKDGDTAWCVSVTPKGFGGEIAMMVSILRDDDGTLRVGTISIISHAETMGDPRSESFLGQYSGLTNGIALGDGENSVDAMTGATVSSKAVTLGVNNALDAVKAAIAHDGADESGVNG